MNRCAFLDSEHKFTLTERPVKKPADNEITVQIKANGICGSDIHFYHEGRLGNFIVTKPYIPGHEASGVITEAGRAVRGFYAGEHVVIEPGIPCGMCKYCRTGRYNLCREVVFLSAPPVDGTFCDYVTIRADCVHKIPADLSFEKAALIEPVAVAVHAVNRASFQNGASAVVVGAGPIGLLTLQAFKAAGGGRVTCVDRMEKRLQMAKELGADEVINIGQEHVELNDLGEVVFETAGSARATETLFKLACAGGIVVQVGWPNGNVVPVNIADFLDKELLYTSVNRYANAFPTAVSWVADGRINVERLITHRFDFGQTAEAFRFTLENAGEVIKTVVIN